MIQLKTVMYRDIGKNIDSQAGLGSFSVWETSAVSELTTELGCMVHSQELGQKTFEPQLPVDYAKSQTVMFETEMAHSKYLTRKQNTSHCTDVLLRFLYFSLSSSFRQKRTKSCKCWNDGILSRKGIPVFT